MGYDLRSRRGHKFRIQARQFMPILDVATLCGWKREGALVNPQCSWEDKMNWRGWYLSNDDQTVTQQDAANLASALERALRMNPDDLQVIVMALYRASAAGLMDDVGQPKAERSECELHSHLDIEQYLRDGAELSPRYPFPPHSSSVELQSDAAYAYRLADALRYLGDEEYRDHLRQFISFCRSGSFTIS